MRDILFSQRFPRRFTGRQMIERHPPILERRWRRHIGNCQAYFTRGTRDHSASLLREQRNVCADVSEHVTWECILLERWVRTGSRWQFPALPGNSFHFLAFSLMQFFSLLERSISVERFPFSGPLDLPNTASNNPRGRGTWVSLISRNFYTFHSVSFKNST